MRLNIVNKRIIEGIRKIKNSQGYMKFNLGTLAVILTCLMLLILSTFTQIKYTFLMPTNGETFYFEYIPQIPIVIFIATLLGKRWSIFIVLLYIILGLVFYPVFGLGGGFSYVFQYSFGYILSYVFASYVCAKNIRRKNPILSTILAAFWGIFTIHLIGIIYLVTIAILKHDSFLYIADLIYYQSFVKILYDLIFSIIAIIIARLSRRNLWIITG